MLIGLYFGLYLSRLMSDRVLRFTCVAVLVGIALSSISAPYLK
jgi:hypothetical protein